MASVVRYVDHRTHDTLHRIKQNDDTLTALDIDQMHQRCRVGFASTREEGAYSRLGEVIRENTHLEKLFINVSPRTGLDIIHTGFFNGIERNESINVLWLKCDGRREVMRSILQAYERNNNLTHLDIQFEDIHGVEQMLATTFRRCTNLRDLDLWGSEITDEQLRPIIEAVRGNSRLVSLGLYENRIGNTACEILAPLLQDPNCNLRDLNLNNNIISNEGAITIVNSLSRNSQLKTLYLGGDSGTNQKQIDQSVSGPFSSLVCNTSSINDIYKSNHTLETVTIPWQPDGDEYTHQLSDLNLKSILKTNKGTNKKHVAIKKILQFHPNIDMEPLFELDTVEDERNLKGLPYVIEWFERAREAVTAEWHVQLRSGYSPEERKLSAIYQFARVMPLQFIPSRIKTCDKKRKRSAKRL